MAATIITTEDLREFKEELLEAIKAITNQVLIPKSGSNHQRLETC